MEATLNVEAVKALAPSKGFDSLSALARESGIQRTHLTNILAGRRKAQPSHVLALAEALGVSPLALLGPEDVRSVVIDLAKRLGVTADELEAVPA